MEETKEQQVEQEEHKHHHHHRRRHQNRVLKFIKFTLFTFLVIACLFFFFTVLKAKVFSIKYILLIFVVLGIICGLMALFTWPRKAILNIVGCILMLLLICGLIMGMCQINKSISLLENLINGKQTYTTYYVAVFEDSEFERIADLRGKKAAALDRNIEAVTTEINRKISITVDPYMSIADLTKKLGDKEVDAIIVSESIFEYINSEDNCKEDCRKLINIGEISVMDNKEKNSTIDAEKPFLLYLGGLDGWKYNDGGNISDTGLADVNILAAINPVTHRILLVNIPRDYYVRLHGTSESDMKDKLTHAGMYGVEMSVSTLEDLFEINIDGYIKVNFGAVIGMVDAIDGIDVYSDQAFRKGRYNFKVGMNHFDGEKALVFARTRNVYYYGDRHRGMNQQAIITAIIKKVSSDKKYLMKYDEILKELTPYFSTSLDMKSVQVLIKNQLDTMSGWDVESISVDGEGKDDYSYSFPDKYRYVMIPDMETVHEAQNKIKEVLKEVK